MNSLSVIILTFNEEKHIERCIKSMQKVAQNIYIIDSFSTDKTREIARDLGAIVHTNPWVNYANQFNWAIENCGISTTWTMRMDCDEYLTDELVEEINNVLSVADESTGGYIIKRRVLFMGKWMKYGGFYPHRLLRIWRTGTGVLEERWMDEHVVVRGGNIEKLRFDMVDHNLNDLTWWINKHNGYASREIRDLIDIKNASVSSQNVESTLMGEQYSRKRWIKENIYSYVPLFVRPLFYFFYRYFILLGFLDGTRGIIWHFLQAFWYRFLVDAKLYETNLRKKNEI